MSRTNLLSLMAAIAVIALIAAPATAGTTDYAWIGADGGDWGTDANWNPVHVPNDGVNDDAVFDSGAEGTVNIGANSYAVDEVDFASGDHTLAGSTGVLTASLIKNQGGTNTIAAQLSMTGGTVDIDDGTLVFDKQNNDGIDAATVIDVAADGTLKVSKAGALGGASIVLDGGTIETAGQYFTAGDKLLWDTFRVTDSGDSPNGFYDRDGQLQSASNRDTVVDPTTGSMTGSYSGEWSTRGNRDAGTGGNTGNAKMRNWDTNKAITGWVDQSTEVNYVEGTMAYWRRNTDDQNPRRQVNLLEGDVAEYWFSTFLKVNNDAYFAEMYLGFDNDFDKFVTIGVGDSQNDKVAPLVLKTKTQTVTSATEIAGIGETYLLVGHIEVDYAGDETITYYFDPTDVSDPDAIAATATGTLSLTEDLIGAGERASEVRYQGNTRWEDQWNDDIRWDDLRIADSFADLTGASYGDIIDLSDNDVTVNAGMTSAINSSAGALFGDLTMQAAAQLDVTGNAGVAVSFGTITSQGSSTLNAAIDTPATNLVTTAAGTFWKRGTGALDFDGSSDNSLVDGTVLKISDGGSVSMIATAANASPLATTTGGADLELDGGTYDVSGQLQGAFPASTVAWFDYEQGDGAAPVNQVSSVIGDGTLVGDALIDSSAAQRGSGGLWLQNNDNLEGHNLGKLIDAGFDISDDDFTIAFWFNTAETSESHPRIFGDKSSYNANDGVSLEKSGDDLKLRSSTDEMNVNNALTTDEWIHIACVYDKDGSDWSAQLYLDGDLANSDSNFGTVNPGDVDFFIGAVGDSGEKSAHGFIDDFAILAEALDEAGVEALMPGPVSAVALDMTDTDVTVSATSTLSQSTATEVNWGALTFSGDAELTITGGIPTTFTGTTLNANAVLSPDARAHIGAVDDGGVARSLAMNGTGTLVLTDATSLVAGSSVAANAGTTVGVHSGTNPFGAADLEIGAATLVLASGDGNHQTFDNTLTVTGAGTLIAGADGEGAVGPLTITLGSTSKTVTLNADLAVETNSDYDLEIASAMTGAGGLTKSGDGDLQIGVAGGGTTNNYFGATTLLGGNLIIKTPVTQTSGISVQGGGLTADAATTTSGTIDVVGGDLTANDAVIAAGAISVSGGNLTASGSGGTVESTGGNISVSGGNLTANDAVTAAGDVLVSGDPATTIVAANAPITATNIILSGGRFNANVAGSVNADIAINNGELWLNIAGAIAGGKQLNLNSGGTLVVGADGAMTGVTANTSGVYYINVDAQQSVFPGFDIKPSAAIGGDMDNADYDYTAAADKVSFQAGAVFAPDLSKMTGPAYNLPTTLDLGEDLFAGNPEDYHLIYRGMVGKDADMVVDTDFDGGATTTDDIYGAGVALGPWTLAGDFTGSITQYAGADGDIDVLMSGYDLVLGDGTTAAQIDINNPGTDAYNFTGAGLLTVKNATNGSGGSPALLINRLPALADIDDDEDTLVLLLDAANVVASGQTYTVENGRVVLDHPIAIAAGGTLVVGPGAGLDMDSGQTLLSGAVTVKGPSSEPGLVAVDTKGDLATIATLGTFEPSSMIALVPDGGNELERFDFTDVNSVALPTDVIYILGRGGDTQDGYQDLALTKGGGVYGRAGGGSMWSANNDATDLTFAATDGVDEIVHLGMGGGSTFEWEKNVNLLDADGFDGNPVYADVYVNRYDTVTDGNLDRVRTNGTVQIEQGFAAGNVTIWDGELQFATNADPDITGIIHVKSDGRLELPDRVNLQSDFSDGTFGSEIRIDNGGQMETRFDYGTYIEYAQTIVFTGAGPADQNAYWEMDEQGGSGQKQWNFNDVRFQEGAFVATDRSGLTATQWSWDLTLEGSGTLVRQGNDGVKLESVDATGAHTLTLGTADMDANNLHLYGPILGGATVELVNAQLYADETSAGLWNGTINTLGADGSPDYQAAYLQFVNNEAETVLTWEGGTVNVSGGENVRFLVRRRDSLADDLPAVLKFDHEFNIVQGAQNIDAVIETDRGSGDQNEGIVWLTNVHIEDGARADYDRRNNSDLVMDVTVDAGTGYVRNDDTTDHLFFGDIVGPGTLVIEGSMRRNRLIGTQTGTTEMGGGDLVVVGAGDQLQLNGYDMGYAGGLVNGVVNVKDGQLRFWREESIGAGGVINILGADGGAGWSDGYLQFNADNLEEHKTWSLGEINVNGGENVRFNVRRRDSCADDMPTVLELITPLKVANGAGEVDAVIETDRGSGGSNEGIVWLRDVRLADGARAEYDRINNSDLVMDVTVEAGTGYVRNTDTTDHLVFGNISGPGVLVIEGNRNARMIGAMGTDVVWNSSHHVLLSDQDNGWLNLNGFDLGYTDSFELGGNTLTVADGWADVYDDPGAGTIKLETGGNAFTNRGADGSYTDPDLTYELGAGGGALAFAVDESINPDPEITVTIDSPIVVTGEGTIGSVRGADEDNAGKLEIADVRFQGGQLNTDVDNNIDIRINATLQGDGTINNDDHDDRVYVRDVTDAGANTLTLAGSERIRVLGDIAVEDIVFSNTEEVEFITQWGDTPSLTATTATVLAPVEVQDGSTYDVGTTTVNAGGELVVRNTPDAVLTTEDTVADLVFMGGGAEETDEALAVFQSDASGTVGSGDGMDVAVRHTVDAIHQKNRLLVENADAGENETLTFDDLTLDAEKGSFTFTIDTNDGYTAAFDTIESGPLPDSPLTTRVTLDLQGALTAVTSDLFDTTDIIGGGTAEFGNTTIDFGLTINNEASGLVTFDTLDSWDHGIGSVIDKNGAGTVGITTSVVGANIDLNLNEGWLRVNGPNALQGITTTIAAGTGIDVATDGLDMSALPAADNLKLSAEQIGAVAPTSPVAGALVLNFATINDGAGIFDIEIADQAQVYSEFADDLVRADYQETLSLAGDAIFGDAGQDFTVSGAIEGAGNLVKRGGTTVTLSGTGAYLNTRVEDGTLVIADAGAIGTGTFVVEPETDVGGASVGQPIAQIDAAGIDFNTHAATVAAGGRMDINGDTANLTNLVVQAADLDSPNGILNINNSMVGATAPVTPVYGTMNVNVDAVDAGYNVLFGDGTAGGTIHATLDADLAGDITDGNDMTLSSVAETTLTFSDADGFNLTGSRIWTVPEDATVDMATDIGGAFDLTKAGEGSLILSGSNTFNKLTIGTSPGGWVIATSAAGAPATVEIGRQSAYTVQELDHDYSEVDTTSSRGVLALSMDTDKDLTFSSDILTLGAAADSTYSGNLTPNAGLYMLGGGGAQLTVDDVLGDTGTSLQIGWDPSDDDPITGTTQGPIAGGTVVLTQNNAGLTGNVDLWLPTGLTDANALSAAATVVVHEGGAVDLNNTGHTVANIDLQGGGISNSGGSFTVAEIATLFPAGDYIIGGPGAGNTDVDDGAFVRGTANLRKIGSNSYTMTAPGTPPSANTYAGWQLEETEPDVFEWVALATKVEGGTLVVPDVSSLGDTGRLEVWAGGTLELPNGGAFQIDPASPPAIAGMKNTVAFGGNGEGAAVLDIGTGQTLLLEDDEEYSFNGDVILAEGKLDLGIGWIGGTGGTVTVQDGASIALANSLRGRMGSDWAVIESGGIVDFTGNRDGDGGRIGDIYPGGMVRVTDANGHFVSGSPQDDVLDFQVASINPADWSSKANPYKFDLPGNGVDPIVWGYRPNGDHTFEGVVFSDEVTGELIDAPVNYIEITGGGALRMGRDHYDGIADTETGDFDNYKFYYVVDGSALELHNSITSQSALGATAKEWVQGDQGHGFNPPKGPGFETQHLEGIEVKNGGAVRIWGTYGFIDESVWQADAGWVGVDTDGDGWNPGEFLFENGTSLGVFENGTLRLGFEDVTEGTFLAYPTIKGPGAGSNAELNMTGGSDGHIYVNSGFDVDATSSTGKLDLNIDGPTVHLTGNLAGAQPVDVIENLSISSGAVIYNTTHGVKDTTINTSDSKLAFDPGDGVSIEYGDPAGHTVMNDGMIQALSGSTDMGAATIISSTPLVGAPTGDLQVDEGATLMVGGFQNHAGITVNGNLALTDTTGIASDASSLGIGTTGQLDLASGATSGVATSLKVYADDIAAAEAAMEAMVVDGRIIDSNIGDHGGSAIGIANKNDGADYVEARLTRTGDINVDATVDFADFSLLSVNYGQTNKTWDEGDLDRNDVVDFADFSLLSVNYGQNYTPEPATLALMGVGLVGMTLLRRRRSQDRKAKERGIAMKKMLVVLAAMTLGLAAATAASAAVIVNLGVEFDYGDTFEAGGATYTRYNAFLGIDDAGDATLGLAGFSGQLTALGDLTLITVDNMLPEGILTDDDGVPPVIPASTYDAGFSVQRGSSAASGVFEAGQVLNYYKNETTGMNNVVVGFGEAPSGNVGDAADVAWGLPSLIATGYVTGMAGELTISGSPSTTFVLPADLPPMEDGDPIVGKFFVDTVNGGSAMYSASTNTPPVADLRSDAGPGTVPGDGHYEATPVAEREPADSELIGDKVFINDWWREKTDSAWYVTLDGALSGDAEEGTPLPDTGTNYHWELFADVLDGALALEDWGQTVDWSLDTLLGLPGIDEYGTYALRLTVTDSEALANDPADPGAVGELTILPEPGTMVLLGLGGLLTVLRRRR